MDNNKVFSIIILAYDSGVKITLAYDKLSEIFEEENIKLEFIIVNDGSKDGNKTQEVSIGLKNTKDNVFYFELSRNYTSHYASFAGLSKSTGGVAALITDDEQQLYDTLVKSYRLCEKGEKIIFPVRSSRTDPKISKIFSGMFYWSMSMTMDYDYPKHRLDIWVIDRKITDIIKTQISPRNTSTITEILYLGYDPKLIFYERPKAINLKIRWSFPKKLKLASDWFFSTTRFPLKLVTFVGIGSFLLSLSMIVFYT
jgi:glycosyltransferase involved in cell wall biosynthesis